jgi:hypothetical protein
MSPKVRADIFKCVFNTHLHRFRMEPMDEQKTGNQLVCRERIEGVIVELPGIIKNGEHPFEASPIELNNQPDQLLRSLSGNGTAA